MKKINKLFILVSLILMIAILWNCTINAACSFEETSKSVIDLGYGVTVEEVHGNSKSDFLSYTSDDNRGQSIYTALVNQNSPAKIVQWTVFPNGQPENSWGVTTLSMIAKDYESKNPGKKVLVATNNWLSGTNSNNTGELDGVQIADGLNYRVSDKQGNGAFSHDYIPRPFILGWDKDGNMIYDDDYNSNDYTSYLVLSYYNGVGQEKTYLDLNVTKINSIPEDNEIAIYFSNCGEETINVTNAKIIKMEGIVRHDNAVTTDFIERDAFAFGKSLGEVDSINFIDQNKGTYYFVSKNDSFNKLDLSNKQLVCQYELLGDLSTIIGATTYYYHIVRDGVLYNNNYNNDAEDAVEWSKGHQINNEVHPRTVYFQREDGTYGLSVIDGRRQSEGMTGMDYSDMAYFYGTYYNAYNVFNYDGGGSSAIVIANSTGGFDCINSPSDGHQRGVANACLIVVDEQPFKISCAEDETNKIVLNIKNIGENVEKIYASLNSITLEAIKDNNEYKIVFDNLEKENTYLISYSWKYKNDDTIYYGAKLSYETASQYAYLDYYDIKFDEDGVLKINLKVIDSINAFTKGTVTVNGSSESFRDLETEISFFDLEPYGTYEISIKINSKVGIKNYLKETKIEYHQEEPAIIEPVNNEQKSNGCNKGFDLICCGLIMIAVGIGFGFRKIKYKKED